MFLSGLSVGLVYAPRARKHGLWRVAWGCLQRALKLYGVHIALTAAALIVFLCAWGLSGVQELIEAHGRSYVFASPASGLTGLALMSHQLGYFNILPLYVVLMPLAPVALALAMWDSTLALLASLGLYLSSRAFGVNLPSWPEAGGWFFNPLAWQLCFTLGLASAIVWRNGPPQPTPRRLALSAGALLMAAVVTTSAAGLAPGLREFASAHLDLAKQDLGAARLAHFLALAYLLAVLPGLARLTGGALGRSVQSLGRNSLPVFTAGAIVSALGQAILGGMSPHASGSVEHLAGFAYTVAGISSPFRLGPLDRVQDSAIPSSSFALLLTGAAAALKKMSALLGSGAFALMLAIAPAGAQEPDCPSASAALALNGTAFVIPRGGAGRPLDILAIGSSSTEGIGASSPDHTYPAQLEDELVHDDGIPADVKNAGVGGEIAAKTLPRLLIALKAGWARLAIWQVGTNDALSGVDEGLFRDTVEKGVAAARAAGIPLVLMDPQYTFRTPDPNRYERFVAIVDAIGAHDHVPVLSRFAMMKRWGLNEARSLLSADGLHMNNRGYDCVAHAIADAIEAAAGAKL